MIILCYNTHVCLTRAIVYETNYEYPISRLSLAYKTYLEYCNFHN